MADQEFLSQEEIDLLLQTLGKEEEEVETEVEYKPFDINQLERILPTRLVKLEQILNSWIATATSELRSIVFNLDAISVKEIKTEKISDFVLKIPLPAAIAVLNVESLNGRMYLVLDTRLIYTIISIILGGPAQPYKIEGRNFTKFELRIIGNLVDILVKHLSRAWEEFLGRGGIEFAGIEENPRRLITVSRNERVIVITLEVEIEGFKGSIYLAIPMRTIDPIKDILRSAEMSDEDVKGVLVQEIMFLTVSLAASLPQFKMTLGRIVDLKEGDFIPLDPRSTENVTVKVQGVPLFSGILGESSGKKAVKIKSYIDRHERGTG